MTKNRYLSGMRREAISHVIRPKSELFYFSLPRISWKCKTADFPLIDSRFMKAIKTEQRPVDTRTDPRQTVYCGMHKHNKR